MSPGLAPDSIHKPGGIDDINTHALQHVELVNIVRLAEHTVHVNTVSNEARDVSSVSAVDVAEELCGALVEREFGVGGVLGIKV